MGLIVLTFKGQARFLGEIAVKAWARLGQVLAAPLLREINAFLASPPSSTPFKP